VKTMIGLAALALGCSPSFYGVSPPPPGYTAVLHTAADTISISSGVALAFECRSASYSPCEKATATVDDPAIAKVMPAYFNQVSERWTWGGPKPVNGFVVIGLKPGATTIRVKSDNGDGELKVSVVQ